MCYNKVILLLSEQNLETDAEFAHNARNPTQNLGC